MSSSSANKMPDIVHRGTCHNMILQFDDPRTYNNAVASVNGGRFEIVLRKEKAKRSNQANKYYWAAECCAWCGREMRWSDGYQWWSCRCGRKYSRDMYEIERAEQ